MFLLISFNLTKQLPIVLNGIFLAMCVGIGAIKNEEVLFPVGHYETMLCHKCHKPFRKLDIDMTVLNPYLLVKPLCMSSLVQQSPTCGKHVGVCPPCNFAVIMFCGPGLKLHSLQVQEADSERYNAG